MGAVALAVIWAGYAAGMWGYCLVRGYCVSPMDVINPQFPARAAAQGAGKKKAAGGGASTVPPIPSQAQSPNGPGTYIPVVPNPQDPMNPSPGQGTGPVLA